MVNLMRKDNVQVYLQSSLKIEAYVHSIQCLVDLKKLV